MAKYKLTSVKKEWCGITLFQIEALISFGDISKGDKGGFIEKESNLSQDGNAWVYGNAQVSGDAWVSGNAQVSGNAWVYGNAQVSGNAWVSGKLKLTLGYFFGLRYQKEEIKYVKLDKDYEIVCKGDIKFGEEENRNPKEIVVNNARYKLVED